MKAWEQVAGAIGENSHLDPQVGGRKATGNDKDLLKSQSQPTATQPLGPNFLILPNLGPSL